MSDVKETTKYESCVELLEEDTKTQKVATLCGFLGIEDDVNMKEWQKHWVGMPEFENKENKPFKTIYLHFRTEEDYKAFANLIEQDLTNKTKSIWYPKLDVTKNSLMRWIEEDE